MNALQFLPAENRNMLDHIIAPMITDLSRQVNELCDQNESWEAIEQQHPEKWQSLLDESKCTKDDWYDTIRDGYIKASVMEDELMALSEIRIIYAFKNLELNIKRLLTTAYPGVNKRTLGNWDQLMDFLNAKGIRPEQLPNYVHVDNLRNLNNALKHSLEINDKVKRIPEFSKAAVIGYQAMDAFYRRISDEQHLFLESLCNAVWAERFTFDDSRLDMLAEEFAIRLDKDKIVSLYEKLLAKVEGIDY